MAERPGGPGEPLVDAKGLYHIYREGELETVALRGAELTLAPGEWVSVVGPSGSGKSTLLHVLAGLLEPSGGQVMMGGRDITRFADADRARLRRSTVGVVLQRDNLHPQLTAAQNVALPLELAGAGREARQRASELLDRMSLRARSAARPHRLSGGEAQRVAIAVAIAGRPRLLLADELTGELDETNTETVLDLLAEVRASEQTTILTVTHNQRVAERADRRLIMQDGVLHEAS